jgi:low affinity Fe/Cu permease
VHEEPPAHHANAVSRLFTMCATVVAHAAGKPLAFAVCLAVIIVWAASGPIFGFSDTWQLIINTGTTIITFLMVFLCRGPIQTTDNIA